MGWWRISADTLASSRFTVSALAETTACLLTLARGAATHPGERAWLDAFLPAYRRRLAADPVTAALVGAAYRSHWIADYLAPAPGAEREQGFDEELARVRRAPAAAARDDVAVTLGGPLPDALRDADLPRLGADLLEWVWRHTVLPDWQRRRRVIEADVVARTRQLSGEGWAAALDDMRPGMRWLGEGRLQINAHARPPREISGARMLFVPVTGRHGWVAWNTPDACAAAPNAPDGDTQRRYAVVFPCSGQLADAGRAPAPGALGALLGPARAGVLVLLDTPKSTTQLVALTGQGLGSVGRHLRVLREARLVGRRRAGRSVLYYRTAVGDAVVRAQGR